MAVIYPKESKLSEYFTLAKINDVRLQRYGLRLLKINGQFMQEIILTDGADYALTRIKKKLPSDVLLVQNYTSNYFMQAYSPAYAAVDAVYMVFASSEWSKVEEGDEIPELELIFKDERMQPVINKRLDKWYWRVYYRIREYFVLKFPNWIK